jgi:large subunit ribosomal protein L5
LNIGCGSSRERHKKAKSAQDDLSAIAGQMAVVTKAKKSIAGFRVREDAAWREVLFSWQLRMYEFLTV